VVEKQLPLAELNAFAEQLIAIIAGSCRLAQIDKPHGVPFALIGQRTHGLAICRWQGSISLDKP
jgi:hypothetical protein